ncbi:hypothetical protein SISNIDRAFT_398432, partial [Sistotremastrum niveocremeum HHB9708]
SELYWGRYQPWLKSIGYVLRARFQPDWKPSWLTSDYPKLESEDYLMRALVLDAKRASDGFPVALKLVPTATQEIPIWRYLSSPEMLADTRNHCVPLLAVHPLPDTDESVLAVMPLLLNYQIPRFDTVGEVISCVYHLIQGLAFLHEHHVTHLDICPHNTMYDPGTKLFPQGFHPVRFSLYQPDPNSPRLASSLPHASRTLGFVKFYYIDFGQSVSFEAREYIYGAVGHDLDVPEFATGESYDPFALDIRAMGDMLHDALWESYYGYKGLEFIKPIVTEMQRDNPKERPSAMDVLSKVHSLL